MNSAESTKLSQPNDAGRVCAVIPTRNRVQSLQRLLRSLSAQTRTPDEVIVVDASNVTAPGLRLSEQFPSLSLRVIPSHPSLSHQRNQGIALACAEFILLADDDIEFPPAYIDVLLRYLKENPDDGAVSGTLHEPADGKEFVPDHRAISSAGLLWAYVFQTSVWGDISPIELRKSFGILIRPLLAHYRRLANTHTMAGWPVLTETTGPVFRTAVYGLGGALIRRQWLRDSPFDEALEEHGIGDNFGVALGFPRDAPICVLTSINYLHHRDPSNRLAPAAVLSKRIDALDYFLKSSPRFTLRNRAMLRWSILGLLLYHLWKGSPSTAWASAASLGRLITGRNPLTTRRARRKHAIAPAD